MAEFVEKQPHRQPAGAVAEQGVAKLRVEQREDEGERPHVLLAHQHVERGLALLQRGEVEIVARQQPGDVGVADQSQRCRRRRHERQHHLFGRGGAEAVVVLVGRGVVQRIVDDEGVELAASRVGVEVVEPVEHVGERRGLRLGAVLQRADQDAHQPLRPVVPDRV